MFHYSYRLPFRLFGIPVLLDISLLIVLPLLAWLIGKDIALYAKVFELNIDPSTLQQGWTPYWLGMLAALGLFLSVLIHELGHSLVGFRYGLKVKSITLWILGGVAQFERMPRRRGAEAVVAIAGPVTSYALGLGCWALLSFVPSEMPEAQFVLAYLLFMNVILATFNLLPAMPLDGGRVLRSLLAMKVPYLRATQISANVSKMLAILLGLLGFLGGNLFLMLIAFFVFMAVSGETQMAAITEVLKGLRIGDLMTREVRTVRPNELVSGLIHKMFEERHLGYPVVDDGGKLIGMVSLDDVRRARSTPGVSEHQTQIQDIMHRDPQTISERTSALKAFNRMSSNNFNRLVVVDSSGAIKGIVTKTDLIRTMQVRMVGMGMEGPSEAGA